MRRSHYSSVDASHWQSSHGSHRRPGAAGSVRVLYDFEYVSSEGKTVTIKCGEKLTLLDKTDDEWWKVSRFKTPFYVPAKYVSEVSTTIAAAAGLPAASAFEESTMKYRDVADWAGGGMLALKWRVRTSAEWSGSSAMAVARASELHRGSSDASVHASSAVERLARDDFGSEDAVRHHASGSGGMARRALLKAVGGSERRSPMTSAFHTRGRYTVAAADNHSSSSSSSSQSEDDDKDDKSTHQRPMVHNDRGTTDVTAASRSALVRGGRFGLNHADSVRQKPHDVKLAELAHGDDYAVSKRLSASLDVPSERATVDEVSQTRSVNGQSSPVVTMSSSGDVALGYRQHQDHEKLTKKPSINRSPLKGWTETADGRGQRAFIHTATGDRWLCAEDPKSGRPYYYKENTDRTVWELPDYATPANVEPLASRPASKLPAALERRATPTRSISTPEPKAEQGESEEKEIAMEKGPPPPPTTLFPAAALLAQAGSRHMSLLVAVVGARRDSTAAGAVPAAADAPGAGVAAVSASAMPRRRPYSFAGALESDVSVAENGDQEAFVDEDGSGCSTPSSSEVSPSWTNSIGDANSSAVGRLRQMQDNGTAIKVVLQICRVFDSSRKNVKKRWELSSAVLKAAQLLIYKEEKSPTKKAADDLVPDVVLNLQSAKVSWSSLRGSKKCTLEVACDNGCYLLRHDDQLVMRELHSLLVESQSLSGQKQQQPAQLPESKETSSSYKDLAGLGISDDPQADESATDGSWKTKSNVFKRGGYDLNHSSNLVGVREKLKGLLARRPAIKDLEAKGILRESIFSTHLLFLCNREQTTVPKFVERCISAIEAKGLDVEGLYRIAPSAADVQALRNQIDSDSFYTLSQYDVHLLASTLKMFFRELQEPLIPFDYYNMFIDALNIANPVNRLSKFKLLISMLMPASRDTLHTLAAHLLRVSEHSEKNKMTLENIATIFGQTLMRPEEDSRGASLTSALVHNRVIEYILINYDKIF